MLGERLKQLRLNKALSQQELSTLLNTSNANISNWERNISVPDADTLIKIANYFNVSVDYLLNIQQEDKDKIELLRKALKDAGLMEGEDLTLEELEKAIKIAKALRDE